MKLTPYLMKNKIKNQSFQLKIISVNPKKDNVNRSIDRPGFTKVS